MFGLEEDNFGYPLEEDGVSLEGASETSEVPNTTGNFFAKPKRLGQQLKLPKTRIYKSSNANHQGLFESDSIGQLTPFLNKSTFDQRFLQVSST